jgi:hypothetical protein
VSASETPLVLKVIRFALRSSTSATDYGFKNDAIGDGGETSLMLARGRSWSTRIAILIGSLRDS